MNKLAIPAILVATVLVAGMFAFMPVQQASTVHTTLASGENTAVLGVPISDSTPITSVQGNTAAATYRYTADEEVTVIAIEVTADISGFTDAGDTVEVNDVTLDGFSILAGALAYDVSIGTDGAADTINVFLEDWNSINDGQNYLNSGGGVVVTPNTGGLVVVVEVTEAGNNDANTAIAITVTFYTIGSGAVIEDILVTQL